MDPRIESEIQKLRKFLEGSLGPIKDAFGPRSNAMYLTSPHHLIAGVREALKEWEERVGSVDWDKLPEWIDKAVESFRCQYAENTDLLTTLGMGASDMYIDPDKPIDAMIEKIKESPLAQELRREYGPNWASCLDKLEPLSYDTLFDSRDSTPKVESRKPALDRADAVLRDWKTLQAMKERGRLNRFREEWAGLTTSERSSWLQRQYPELPNCPHADIYGWAQSSEPRRKNLDPKLFMTPLLNIEDLSQDVVLPSLLDARATSHPRLFRAIDGRSVSLGLFGGHLKLRAQGRMSFTGRGEAESYGISFQDEVDPKKLLSLYEVTASMGVLQLEAQRRTYNFLVSCTTNFLESSRPDEGIEQASDYTDSNEYLSLLAQSSRLDYYGRPETVDLKYLDNLVKASLDEALDDLWQLRNDPEVWVERLNETPAKLPGRVSNLLHAIFHRIDIFQSLSLHLAAVQERRFCEAQHDGSTDPTPPNLTSLYTAFQSSLDEELCRFQDTQWSPRRSTSTAFTQLFNMVRENDATVWVMGLPQVMRVIDLEIRKDGTEETIPFTVMRALNDISVFAVGVRETWKHYNFVSHPIDNIYLVNELEAKWVKRQRPWKLVIENTLQALPKRESHKLDTYLRKSISPRLQHLEFWTVVDKHMKESSQGVETNDVVDMILQAAPIDTTTPVENVPTDSWIMCEAETAPSNTQLRRSRYHRRPPPADLSPTISPAKRPSLQPLIRIEPASNTEFWTALLAPSLDNSTALHWNEFCNAMIGIGYRIIPQTGSVYRFEYDERGSSTTSNGNPGTIIFHAPHGGGKVTHRQARSWWLRRLLSRFEVIV
jgi:hypothetical protein